MNSRDLAYEYISKRRSEELEALIIPSWPRRTFRHLGSFSVSALGFGLGGGRRDLPENDFARQIRALSKVKQDLHRHKEIGRMESGARYVEHELTMGYSLWSFRAGAGGAERTAALWYGDDEGGGGVRYQVVLIGNPKYLRGVPDGAFSGIPMGTTSADPAQRAAFRLARSRIEQLAWLASGDGDLVEIPDFDFHDRDRAGYFVDTLDGIGRRMYKGDQEGNVSEAIDAKRRFLARRVAYSRAGNSSSGADNSFFGTPVYVATVEPSRPAEQ